MLEVTDLSFAYQGNSILDAVHLQVKRPGILSLVGPNGTGKTTLLKCIAGILRTCEGSVCIDGTDVRALSRRELARRIGYVPQNISARFPLTVFESVLAGRRPHMAWRPSRIDLERVAAIIAEMELCSLAMREMTSLSGGQVQRVLLARALAQDSAYLLLDEPTSNLDLRHQLEMLEMIAKLTSQKSLGVIMAMHDLNLAARFSETIIMVHQGKIHCSGSPSEVMTPENIADVYGVEVDVRCINAHLQIQALRCA
nr:ABC transporter ATP-binding protein [uncultured Desulfobulbus sp.]